MSSEKKRLKIAFVTALDPKDRHSCSWTDTMYCTSHALQRQSGEVYYLGPIKTNAKRFGQVVHKVSRLLFKRNFLFDRSIFLAKAHAKVVSKRLAAQSFDVIIAPMGTTEVAYLETDIPIVIVRDATFALMHNYYPKFSNLLNKSVREGYYLERLANERSSLLLYPSAWAARSAVEDHRADKEKVHVVPFGANFEAPPIEIVQKRAKSDRCRLLFVGVDWPRKGGEIAFETLLKLDEMGVQAELIVCGCTPPKEFSHARMKVIPFLDKNDEEQRLELEKLFEMADFLLLPSRSECYGMVFCEASAFGLPSITTNTGGISGAVTNGENGYMLPPGAGGAEYARLIAEIYLDDHRYAELVKSSRAAFDARLNWDAWAISVDKLIREELDRRGSDKKLLEPAV